MASATVLGLLFVPVFFVLIRGALAARQARRRAASGASLTTAPNAR